MSYESLVEELVRYAQSITPLGMRFIVDGRLPLLWASIDLCCDGADPDLAYYCGRASGHDGLCYSNNRQVPFRRRN